MSAVGGGVELDMCAFSWKRNVLWERCWCSAPFWATAQPLEIRPG